MQIEGAEITSIDQSEICFEDESFFPSKWKGKFAGVRNGRITIYENPETYEVVLNMDRPRWKSFDLYFTRLRNNIEREFQNGVFGG